jgi:hypothetical protein
MFFQAGVAKDTACVYGLNVMYLDMVAQIVVNSLVRVGNQYGSNLTNSTKNPLNLSFSALLGLFPAQGHLWAVSKGFQLQQSV